MSRTCHIAKILATGVGIYLPASTRHKQYTYIRTEYTLNSSENRIRRCRISDLLSHINLEEEIGSGVDLEHKVRESGGTTTNGSDIIEMDRIREPG